MRMNTNIVTKDILRLIKQADKETENIEFWYQHKMEHCRKSDKDKWVFVANDVPLLKHAPLTIKKIGRQVYMYDPTGSERWTLTIQVREIINNYAKQE